jgi:hypothetical protein
LDQNNLFIDEMWNCNEIARSFDFRNIANCIQIVDLYITVKALSKKLKARQKTIKLALGIAETNDHGICQSVAVC